MKKLRLLFAIVSATAFISFGFALKEKAIVVSAEGEENTSLVSESSSIESESASSEEKPIDSQTIINKANDWIENKVIPLLGGVSVATIISVVVSIVTAVFKYKGDRTNRTTINDQDKKIKLLCDEITLLKNENSEMKAYQEKMLEQFSLVFSKTKDKMDGICTYALSITENIEEQNSRIANVENMKGTIEVFCNLTAKMFALSDVAVKSGIAEDAQKLIASFSDNQGGETDGENS